MTLNELQKILRLVKKECGNLDVNLNTDQYFTNHPLNTVKLDYTLAGEPKLILTNKKPT